MTEFNVEDMQDQDGDVEALKALQATSTALTNDIKAEKRKNKIVVGEKPKAQSQSAAVGNNDDDDEDDVSLKL